MDVLIRRLRQRVIINYINLNDIFGNKINEINEEDQYNLIEILNEISKNNGYYINLFLKKWLQFLERNNIEIFDEYYEILSELLSIKPLNATDYDIISYSINTDYKTGLDQRILMRETPNVISGLGTTGLRTWEASIYLSYYLLEQINLNNNKIIEIFKDKNILELGTGTGLVGMSVYKYLNDYFKKLYLTDGDSSLIDKLQFNLNLNSIISGNDKSYEDKLKCSSLWWGQDNLPSSDINTLLAADVTYDSDVIPSLVKTIKDSMVGDKSNVEKSNVDTAIVAATVRNLKTLRTWEEHLNMGESEGIWNWQIVDTYNSSDDNDKLHKLVWFQTFNTEIRIYRIDRII
ncbi:hypothetical protein B5S29_g583 [[Candida] boidinii]|uniref:Unnamed protein product n=1 Tax=Candida boidinii TaxID=5477 RepID=A0ACB5TNP7_CANBO|nr:hypothetical protein B5S29_g583 [[Candida] boidinii]GME91626.1 unnamed protein product [[Candida] boidinii]